MLRQGRFQKTPERNLADLDDHLYFLKEDFAKIIGGDAAHVKKIAGLLRTLVCVSSKTEGLLWRVVEHLGADDKLDLQAYKDIDHKNSITRGLSFVIIPSFRTGSGPKACVPKQISLRQFIKEYVALHYKGTSYTHEKLISGIAQQMGVSHESEDVEPHLIVLSGMAMADRSSLVEFLLMNASFTLEVGERVLEFASAQLGFQRRARPPIVIPSRVVEPFCFNEDEHFIGRLETRQKQGTLALVLAPPNPGWETDGRSYNLGTSTSGKITTSAQKHADGTLEIIVYGLAPTVRMKRAPIVTRGKPEIVVILIWNDEKYRIVIDGSVD